MNPIVRNKATLGLELRTLSNGIKVVFAALPNITLGGATYTVAQLLSKFDEAIQAQAESSARRNAFHAAVAAEKASRSFALLLRGQVHAYAISHYGRDSVVLSQLGFTSAPPKKATAAVKAVAVLKGKATRKARNTMGRVQKARIKGTVDPSIAASLASSPVSAAASTGAATAPQVGAGASAALPSAASSGTGRVG